MSLMLVPFCPQNPVTAQPLDPLLILSLWLLGDGAAKVSAKHRARRTKHTFMLVDEMTCLQSQLLRIHAVSMWDLALYMEALLDFSDGFQGGV